MQDGGVKTSGKNTKGRAAGNSFSSSGEYEEEDDDEMDESMKMAI